MHKRIMSDVSVIHVTAATNIPLGQQPLGGAKQREWEKFKKYQKLAIREQASFHPFVVEHTGALGPQAKEIINTVTSDRPFLLDEFETPRAAAAFLKAGVSIILQRVMQQSSAKASRWQERKGTARAPFVATA